MLNIQNYKKVESIEEAYELNQKKANRIVGGMMWMRMGDNRINTAIDMSGLGLDKIEETDEEFKIGCMVGVQFRNLATVGGSIYGRYGFSDVLTLLIGLDSYVELYKGGIVSLKEYAAQSYDRDIIVSIIVKKKPVKMFYEAVRITETDLPVLTCAGVGFSGLGEYNICIGARPGRAVVVEDKEGILNGGVNDEAIESFARYVKENVSTESNMRGSAEYRSHLAEELTKRALRAVNY